MWKLKLPVRKPAAATGAVPEASCPTKPCGTCGNPMPIASFDQRCPRCRTLVAASRSCPGACAGCEMGQ